MTTYGYYSSKQLKIIKHDKKYPYIYWKTNTGTIVQVTEVMDGPYHNNFKDVICMGPLDSWYESSSTIKYKFHIPREIKNRIN
jgi:hypothetical protein